MSSFTVTVDRITFRRAGGATVEVLQQPATLDLAELEGAAALLGGTEVATGPFVGATVTFDFTNAACFLTGQTTAATLDDPFGQPLTGLVTVDLDLTRAPFFAFSRQHHAVEIDFDLDPALTIDVTANAVVVAPEIVVRVDRSDARPVLACGALASVDGTIGAAALALETPDHEPLGAETLAFDLATVFQIDGVPRTGIDGVSTLAALPAGTWMRALGAIDPMRERLAVSYVEAGTGTWSGDQDCVDGVIVARSGGAGADASLTVVGASRDGTLGTRQFGATFTVTTAFATTRVVREGDLGAFDADALNVGQAIRAYGTLAGATLDATAADALVRELATTFAGHVFGVPAGTTLTLALARVGGLEPGAFTWSDGGSTPPDPTQFTLDASALGSGLPFTDGAPVVAAGFLAKIDDADADATALALADYTDPPALFVLRNRANGFEVAATPASGELQLAVTGAPGSDEEAAVDLGFLGRQALPASPDARVVASPSATVFQLRHAGEDGVACYVLFPEFEAALASALANGAALRDCIATGTFDATANTFHAATALVTVE